MQKEVFFKVFHSRFMSSSITKIINMFECQTDNYHGITIDTENLFLNDKEFEKQLSDCLISWIHSGIRGVWFKVNIANSSYIPILVKHNFYFHHAKSSYVMLTRWLPQEDNLLPQYPHTYIGVGGLVINESMQILTIKERYQPNPHWKLPGGYNKPGEDFAATAIREVFEETGINTEFVSLVSLRHHHKHLFNCGDIYIICYLKPLNSVIKKCTEEIAECQWMDVEAYKIHPEVTEFNKFIINSFIENQKKQISIVSTDIYSSSQQLNKVYHVKSI